jgi:predicted amidohydrolase YtcJ
LHGRETPAGSAVVLDAATGTATGELREPNAFDLVRVHIPPPSEMERRAAAKQGLAQCARHGLTSAHNMDNWNDGIAVYAALEDLGELTVRIYVPYNVEPETPIDQIVEAAELKRRYQGDFVRAGAVKVFMDGVLESYTALMVNDYADQPGNRGGALHTAERFDAIAAEADRLGLQIFVHACGDGAVRRTLDGYAHAQRVNGRRDSRHRVEHIELLHPDDVTRFAELGVIASMQPIHCPPPSTPAMSGRSVPARHAGATASPGRRCARLARVKHSAAIGPWRRWIRRLVFGTEWHANPGSPATRCSGWRWRS